MNAINVENISKKFGKVDALKNVSFHADKGEIFGLIGPDGSGKTTLFRILTTLMLADQGQANVAGFDVVKEYKKIRKCVGYMPGRFSLYQDLSVEENLTFFATLFGTTIEENYNLIEDIYIQIEPFKKRRAGALSGGMKQKLALCCALIHKPQVLFLDEPTTGVDPVSRKEFWGMLQRLKTKDMCILVSTPYMDEAVLCDRIGLIKNGELLEVNTPSEIIKNYTENLWAIEGSQMYSLLKELREYPGIKSAFSFGDKNHITVNENFNAPQLIEFLKQKNYKDIELTPITPSIEDVYLNIASENYSN